MKYFLQVKVFFVLFIFCSQNIFAQDYLLLQEKRNSYFSQFASKKQNSNLFAQILPEDNQTPARRAEVVFFISLPFVLLGHFLVAGLVSWGQSSNIQKISIAPETATFLSISSLMVSGAITAFDNYFHFHHKKKSESENRFGISISKPFH